MASYTVLLIDGGDEKNVRRIEAALRLKGYAVTTARTLAQAAECFAANKPEVIVTDTALPDGNGIDFCTRIRDTTDAFILIRASDESLEELKSALRVGDMYYEKEAPPDEIAARVEVAFRQRKKANLL